MAKPDMRKEFRSPAWLTLRTRYVGQAVNNEKTHGITSTRFLQKHIRRLTGSTNGKYSTSEKVWTLVNALDADDRGTHWGFYDTKSHAIEGNGTNKRHNCQPITMRNWCYWPNPTTASSPMAVFEFPKYTKILKIRFGANISRIQHPSEKSNITLNNSQNSANKNRYVLWINPKTANLYDKEGVTGWKDNKVGKFISGQGPVTGVINALTKKDKKLNRCELEVSNLDSNKNMMITPNDINGGGRNHVNPYKAGTKPADNVIDWNKITPFNIVMWPGYNETNRLGTIHLGSVWLQLQCITPIFDISITSSPKLIDKVNTSSKITFTIKDNNNLKLPTGFLVDTLIKLPTDVTYTLPTGVVPLTQAEKNKYGGGYTHKWTANLNGKNTTSVSVTVKRKAGASSGDKAFSFYVINSNQGTANGIPNQLLALSGSTTKRTVSTTINIAPPSVIASNFSIEGCPLYEKDEDFNSNNYGTINIRFDHEEGYSFNEESVKIGYYIDFERPPGYRTKEAGKFVDGPWKIENINDFISKNPNGTLSRDGKPEIITAQEEDGDGNIVTVATHDRWFLETTVPGRGIENNLIVSCKKVKYEGEWIKSRVLPVDDGEPEPYEIGLFSKNFSYVETLTCLVDFKEKDPIYYTALNASNCTLDLLEDGEEYVFSVFARYSDPDYVARGYEQNGILYIWYIKLDEVEDYPETEGYKPIVFSDEEVAQYSDASKYYDAREYSQNNIDIDYAETPTGKRTLRAGVLNSNTPVYTNRLRYFNIWTELKCIFKYDSTNPLEFIFYGDYGNNGTEEITNIIMRNEKEINNEYDNIYSYKTNDYYDGINNPYEINGDINPNWKPHYHFSRKPFKIDSEGNPIIVGGKYSYDVPLIPYNKLDPDTGEDIITIEGISVEFDIYVEELGETNVQVTLLDNEGNSKHEIHKINREVPEIVLDPENLPEGSNAEDELKDPNNYISHELFGNNTELWGHSRDDVDIFLDDVRLAVSVKRPNDEEYHSIPLKETDFTDDNVIERVFGEGGDDFGNETQEEAFQKYIVGKKINSIVKEGEIETELYFNKLSEDEYKYKVSISSEGIKIINLENPEIENYYGEIFDVSRVLEDVSFDDFNPKLEKFMNFNTGNNPSLIRVKYERGNELLDPYFVAPKIIVNYKLNKKTGYYSEDYNGVVDYSNISLIHKDFYTTYEYPFFALQPYEDLLNHSDRYATLQFHSENNDESTKHYFTDFNGAENLPEGAMILGLSVEFDVEFDESTTIEVGLGPKDRLPSEVVDCPNTDENDCSPYWFESVVVPAINPDTDEPVQHVEVGGKFYNWGVPFKDLNEFIKKARLIVKFVQDYKIEGDVTSYSIAVANPCLRVYYDIDPQDDCGFSIDGVHSKYYGIDWRQGEIPQGANFDINTLIIEGGDGESATRANVRRKQIHLDFYFEAENWKSAQIQKDAIVKYFYPKRDRKNKPIMKKIVFDYDPNKYYEYYIEGEMAMTPAGDGYEAGIDLIIPNGMAYSILNTRKSTAGSIESNKKVEPIIEVRMNWRNMDDDESTAYWKGVDTMNNPCSYPIGSMIIQDVRSKQCIILTFDDDLMSETGRLRGTNTLFRIDNRTFDVYYRKRNYESSSWEWVQFPIENVSLGSTFFRLQDNFNFDKGGYGKPGCIGCDVERVIYLNEF